MPSKEKNRENLAYMKAEVFFLSEMVEAWLEDSSSDKSMLLVNGYGVPIYGAAQIRAREFVKFLKDVEENLGLLEKRHA